MTDDECTRAVCPGGHVKGRCKGHSSQTGRPCQKYPVRGAAVCPKHGASAPQVKRAAQLRLLEAADDVAAELVRLALDRTVPPQVKVQAARDLLDRAGLGATQLVQVQHDIADPAARRARIAEIRDELAERRGRSAG